MKSLVAIKYPDGSAAVRVPQQFDVPGYKTPQTVIAAIFGEGPEVVLWPVAEIERNGQPCDMADADYVVDAFGGKDAMNYALSTFCQIRLGRKVEWEGSEVDAVGEGNPGRVPGASGHRGRDHHRVGMH